MAGGWDPVSRGSNCDDGGRLDSRMPFSRCTPAWRHYCRQQFWYSMKMAHWAISCWERKRREEKIHQPPVSVWLKQSDGLAHRAVAYGLSLHHSIADRMDLSVHSHAQTHTHCTELFALLHPYFSHMCTHTEVTATLVKATAANTTLKDTENITTQPS